MSLPVISFLNARLMTDYRRAILSKGQFMSNGNRNAGISLPGQVIDRLRLWARLRELTPSALVLAIFKEWEDQQPLADRVAIRNQTEQVEA